MNTPVALAQAGAAPVQPWEEFQRRYLHSYHLGLYLATNAIPGCFLVIDGPDCLYRKAEWIHVSHDMRSTLLDPAGEHRIVSTLMNAEGVIKSKGDEIEKRILRVGRIPSAELVIINSMPHVTIIGTQYDKVIAKVAPAVHFPVLEVPSRSLSGDWLDGYADTLDAIAGGIDLSGAGPRRGNVAVIGHLMDRNEADQTANVAEIERLVAGAGGECVSVWLSGRPLSHLARARDAGTLVALPHGRKAAERLAQRTGASVIAADLPVGLPSSHAFVRAIAHEIGTQSAAGRWWDDEIRRVTPRVEWSIQRFFSDVALFFAGDPAWFSPLAAMAEEVGARLVFLAAPAQRPIWAPETVTAPSGAQIAPHWSQPLPRLRAGLREMLDQEAGTGVLIGDSIVSSGWPPGRWIPLGLPNFERHALLDAPFLGPNGWLWLLENILTVCTRYPATTKNGSPPVR
jgi:nitrogenase molybdenum-iron protein alpha/beta subunit